MSRPLNIRKLVTEEFQREWIRLHGKKFNSNRLSKVRDQFNLRNVHEEVNKLLTEADDEETDAVRQYHRLNLRYLAKYYATTLSNQIRANADGDFENVLALSIKVFKSNPQYEIYKAYC